MSLIFYLIFLFSNIRFVITVGVVSSKERNPALQISTRNGLIQGSQKTSVLGKVYYSYIGIPYAKPPIGNLRFRSPKPTSNWSNVLNATVNGPCCAGINLNEVHLLKIDTVGEEDCLYLNVFTPKKLNSTIDKNPLPVMMYIYGGGFLYGCNDEYKPDFLIENDVILVVPNYRLAVFGYLSTRDMESSGNWALKDLILALKWIQMNIGEFGGHSNKVTIFGQSAGAANVNALILSPKAQGLFHRAILMSGSFLSFWAYQIDPRKIAFDVGIALGIETNSSKILVKELRKVNARDLLKAHIPTVLTNSVEVLTKGLPFTPVIEPVHRDAVLSKAYPFQLLERGEFNKVPVMTGVTTNEMIFLRQAVNFVKNFIPILDISPGLIVRMTEHTRNKTIVGNKIKEFYFASKTFSDASEEELLKLLAEEAYLRPIRKLASFIAKYSPLYLYQFSYEGETGIFFSSRLSGISQRTFKGVGHIEDVAYLFPVQGHQPSKKDMEITKKLTKIYTNFAKTGNPTPDKDPLLDNVTWPAVYKDKFPYLEIGEKFDAINENFDEKNFRFWEELFETYGQKPFKVY